MKVFSQIFLIIIQYLVGIMAIVYTVKYMSGKVSGMNPVMGIIMGALGFIGGNIGLKRLLYGKEEK